jgi:hypothetical protein
MKKIFSTLTLLFLIFLNSTRVNSTAIVQRAYFSGNNICNYFVSTGIFNQNTTSGNSPGLSWPCGSNKYYVFTSGILAACYIDNNLAMYSCSYKGELSPGYTNDNLFKSNSDFKFYSVKIGDDETTNPDYANWYKMIPYGAPFKDVNSNCIFDVGIDKPGIPDASQTIFICMTDADVSNRNSGEGFGGGIQSPLLFAEIHFTAWGYNDIPLMNDVQFLKYEIINKGSKSWDKFRLAILCDPDIGFSFQKNFIGCDTSQCLGYAYSGDTTVFGAYGMKILRGLINRVTGDTLNFSSFNWERNYLPCEWEPNEPAVAYNYMKGFKSNGNPYYDPTHTPPIQTKFLFSGDPETGEGWVPSKGYLVGCNGYDSLVQVVPGDVRFIIGLGADNFSMTPGDTQKLYFAQMLAQGNTNPNSVTNLKRLSKSTKIIFDEGIFDQLKNSCDVVVVNNPLPDDYYLLQNYPNPFNITTKFKYGIPRISNVKLEIFEITGRKVATLIDGEIKPGIYELNWNASGIASGIYIYRMEVVDKTVSSVKIFSRIKRMALIK